MEDMQTKAPITVVVALFEDLVARGLRALIAEDANIAVIADEVPHEQLDRALGDHTPQVAIVNFGSLRNAGDVRALHAAHPGTRLVVLANRPSLAESNQMLAFGAAACLSKETQARDILNAIHLASRGLRVLPRSSDAAGFAQLSGPELLTPREAEVMQLLQRGLSNGEIAQSLQVGVETVRTHARSIYRKLGVKTRRDVATLATGGEGDRISRPA